MTPAEMSDDDVILGLIRLMDKDPEGAKRIGIPQRLASPNVAPIVQRLRNTEMFTAKDRAARTQGALNEEGEKSTLRKFFEQEAPAVGGMAGAALAGPLGAGVGGAAGSLARSNLRSPDANKYVYGVDDSLKGQLSDAATAGMREGIGTLAGAKVLGPALGETSLRIGGYSPMAQKLAAFLGGRKTLDAASDLTPGGKSLGLEEASGILGKASRDTFSPGQAASREASRQRVALMDKEGSGGTLADPLTGSDISSLSYLNRYMPAFDKSSLAKAGAETAASLLHKHPYVGARIGADVAANTSPNILYKTGPANRLLYGTAGNFAEKVGANALPESIAANLASSPGQAALGRIVQSRLGNPAGNWLSKQLSDKIQSHINWAEPNSITDDDVSQLKVLYHSFSEPGR